jgi:hypothetical protein
MDIIALKEAIAKRKAALYNYTKQCQEGRILNEQMDKLRGNADFTGQQDRYYQLEKDIRRSDLQIEETKKQCDLVSTRLLRDTERFRVEWHERMRQVLEDFHKRQIEFLQQQAMDFSTALPALSALDASRSQVPTAPKRVERTEINMSYTSSGAKASIGSIPLDIEESFPEEAAVPAVAVPPPAAAPPLPDAPPPAAAPPPPPMSPPVAPERTKSFDSVHSVGLDASDDDMEGFVAMGGDAPQNGDGSGAVIASL